MKNQSLRALAAISLIALCTACTITPPRVAYTGPRIAIVTSAPPPPPRVEVVPVQSAPDTFWVQGHWEWEGNQHRWENGHWEHRREHEHWIPHRWEPDGQGRWQLTGGYWHHE